MTQHSSTCEEDYVGDQQILQLLEDSRKAFEDGNKSELMVCVFRCAAFQAVIPEWAADALISLREKMESGRVTDFNEAFGRQTEKVNTRAAKARLMSLQTLVIGELLQLRTKGRSLNDAEIFSEALENLRGKGINVNHRDIQAIYRSHGQFLKKIPRGPYPNLGYAFSYNTLPRPRRRGRNILRD